MCWWSDHLPLDRMESDSYRMRRARKFILIFGGMPVTSNVSPIGAPHGIPNRHVP